MPRSQNRRTIEVPVPLYEELKALAEQEREVGGESIDYRAAVEQTMIDQLHEHGGTWTVNKATMHSHVRVLNQMVRAGQVELVREDADSVTYGLPT